MCLHFLLSTPMNFYDPVQVHRAIPYAEVLESVLNDVDLIEQTLKHPLYYQQ
jgi:hypothetical protein